MYKTHKISLILPCYNEEQGLDILLKKTFNWIDEIIIIDNNSTDATVAIANKYKKTILTEKTQGYGKAYQKGLNYSFLGDIIIMLDADNSYPLEAIEKFINKIQNEGYDFLSGCRFPLSNKHSMPIIKQWSNRFISLLIQKIFKIKLKDSQSGMFVFKKNILNKILSSNPRMGFSQELKLNAWLNPEIKSGEIWIHYNQRSGKIKFRPLFDGINIIKDLLFFTIKNNYASFK